MQRYFINPGNMSDSEIHIDGADAKHISKVMRMNVGDKIVCLDNNGRQALCKITSLEPEVIKAVIDSFLDDDPELPVRTVIAQALIKGDKLDYVIQKGTEFGASAFHLYQSERSVVKWDSGKSQNKVERLKKIAKEAAEQSERLYIPEIQYYPNLKDLLIEGNYEIKVALYEEVARNKNHRGLNGLLTSDPQSLLAVVGPEGGISENEARILAANNVESISLGPRILRSESASLYLLAVLSYHYELSR